MSLEQRVQKDIIAAMKNKEKGKLRGLRAIKAAILEAKTDGSGKAIDEEREIQILQKLIKSRQESLDIYVEQNREDLAEKERVEIQAIEAYLPEQLSEEEIATNVDKIIADLNAESMKDMGKVMGKANSLMQGKVDGKTLAAIVKEKLMG